MYILKPILAGLLAMPLEKVFLILFMFFILGEWLYVRNKKMKIYYVRESVINFMTGFLLWGTEILFSMATLPLLWYIYDYWRLTEIDISSFLTWGLLFVFVDFVEYWFHRFSHHINLLWAAHRVHHLSRFLNLTVGLRTSCFVPLFKIFFYLIFPWMGFAPDTVWMIMLIQVIYQLFVHTQLVGKLGILEYILVTPSAHRVHHGSNDLYIDKNYGKILLIWDMLFGTFCHETEEVNYGLKELPEKDGVVSAMVNPYTKLFRSLASVKGLKTKFYILFKKPGAVAEFYKHVEWSEQDKKL